MIDFSTTIRQWLFNQPARVIDSSTMIESHWLFGLNQPTHEIDYSFVLTIEFNQPTRTIDYSCDWLFNNDSTMHCWLFLWLIIQQWFNSDCLIKQLAWLNIRQWLIVTLIIHSSSQSSSINQLAWLIIRVIGYSTMIRHWLFNQPARVMDNSTTIESHWLFVINPPTHQNWLTSE